MAVDPRQAAGGGQPEDVARDRGDRVDLLLELRSDRELVQSSVHDPRHAPHEADPQPAAGPRGKRHILIRQRDFGPPPVTGEPQKTPTPRRPDLSALVERHGVQRSLAARGVDDAVPPAATVGSPDPTVRRAAPGAAGAVDDQVQGLERRERGRNEQGGAAALDAPEVPLLRQEQERVRPDGRELHDAVRRQPLVRGHVEHAKRPAIESSEAAEGRQPQLAARQLDRVGDGVLGEPVRGRPAGDPEVPRPAARRPDDRGLGGGHRSAEDDRDPRRARWTKHWP